MDTAVRRLAALSDAERVVYRALSRDLAAAFDPRQLICEDLSPADLEARAAARREWLTRDPRVSS